MEFISEICANFLLNLNGYPTISTHMKNNLNHQEKCPMPLPPSHTKVRVGWRDSAEAFTKDDMDIFF